MCSYNEETLEPLPFLPPKGKKEHILIMQDESIFHVNDQQWSIWLSADKAQPIRQKGNGHAIHVSNFLCEKSVTGQISLSTNQLAKHDKLAPKHRLAITNACKIIYPGKGKDDWWDMLQLIVQLRHTIKFFEYLHPGTVGVFVFDCYSAHKAFAEDALNVNNMNVNPGKNQKKLRNTTIPFKNPAPQHSGIKDTCGESQLMTFPEDHPDPSLRGKPKGMLQVLREHKSVWHRFTDAGRIKKPVGICKTCRLLAAKKDALARVAQAEEAGQDERINAEVKDLAEQADDCVDECNIWCCAK